jgi:hypothetical protein
MISRRGALKAASISISPMVFRSRLAVWPMRKKDPLLAVAETLPATVPGIAESGSGEPLVHLTFHFDDPVIIGTGAMEREGEVQQVSIGPFCVPITPWIGSGPGGLLTVTIFLEPQFKTPESRRELWASLQRGFKKASSED